MLIALLAISCAHASSGADVSVPARASEPAAGTSDAAAGASDPDTGTVFVLQTGNRLYPDWREEQRVGLGEEFFIGDTEFTGKVTEYLPDFRLQDGKPISLTQEPNNPAVRVFVQSDSAVVDSTWAFLNFPPHFSPYSFFTFRLLEIVPEGSRTVDGTDDDTVNDGEDQDD